MTLLVSNRDNTLKYFQNKLGLRYKYVGTHAWVVVGNQYIHITEDSGNPVTGSFYHFCIEMENLEDYASSLVAKGVVLIDKSSSNFFVKDPDGNLIEFMEPLGSS